MPTSSTPTSSELAYRFVREQILSGVYAGGEMITEGQVAAATETSRTPVREAFLRLSAEGWLRLFPKKGALVVPVQPEELEQVLEARHLIETHALQKVIDSEKQPVALGDALIDLTERMAAAMQQDDLEAFTTLDTEFHLMIVLSAENDILSDIYRGLRDRLRRMTTRSVWHDQSRMEGIITDHTDLARIVSAGDISAFGPRLMEHMRDTHSRSYGRPARVAAALRRNVGA